MLALNLEPPAGRRESPPKAERVIVGTLLMAAFVLISLGLLLRYAGVWGVPYFAFTTDRGSSCINNFTGYTCDPLTVADIEFHGDIELPEDTTVVAGVYRSTHDFTLDARIEVPPASAEAALVGLNQAFGPCLVDRPSPLPADGLSSYCVLANNDAVMGSTEISSRLYIVGTGIRKDGVRVVALSVRSR